MQKLTLDAVAKAISAVAEAQGFTDIRVTRDGVRRRAVNTPLTTGGEINLDAVFGLYLEAEIVFVNYSVGVRWPKAEELMRKYCPSVGPRPPKRMLPKNREYPITNLSITQSKDYFKYPSPTRFLTTEAAKCRDFADSTIKVLRRRIVPEFSDCLDPEGLARRVQLPDSESNLSHLTLSKAAILGAASKTEALRALRKVYLDPHRPNLHHEVLERDTRYFDALERVASSTK